MSFERGVGLPIPGSFFTRCLPLMMYREELPERRRSLLARGLRLGIGLGTFPVLVVALSYAMYGRSVAEKMATELILPYCLVWWLSLVIGVARVMAGAYREATLCFLISLVLYVVGQPLLSRWLVASMESRVVAVVPSASTAFDALVVLGGGCDLTPDGRPQFAEAGDRLGFALRAYHQGWVQRLIVTGDPLPGLAQSEIGGQEGTDPSRQARRLLIESGVSADDIEELPGTTTYEEIQALKERPDLWRGVRCGLVTSAFHMPRAMRLAHRLGVNVEPCTANYFTSTQPWSIRDWLPNSASAKRNEMILREYLGMWVGR